MNTLFLYGHSDSSFLGFLKFMLFIMVLVLIVGVYAACRERDIRILWSVILALLAVVVLPVYFIVKVMLDAAK